MEKDNITALQAQLLSSRPMNFVFSVIVIASLPLIYLLVYKTGGIKYVFSHTMCQLPILRTDLKFTKLSCFCQTILHGSFII